MIDIEALAAPAFLVEVSPLGSLAEPRLNAAGRAHPELARRLIGASAASWNLDLAQAVRGSADEMAAEMELATLNGDGGVGWRTSLISVLDGSGRAQALLGICREDRSMKPGPAHPDDHLSLALQAIHGAEWRYDVQRGVYEGSDEIATLIGEDTPRPVTWAEWLNRVHPQDLASFLARPEPEGTAEFRFRAVGGELRWARCSRIAMTDEAGAIETVLGIMVDITPERVRETALAELATHDPLTGLLNRRGLRQEFDRLQAELPRGSRIALFAVDLDRFKETNDTHGHAAGDAVLTEVARRLAAAAPDAACARLGGDEFVVVLSVSGKVEAQETCARLMQAFRRPLAFRGRWLSTSASVGVACATKITDVARMLDDADADLYMRKRDRTRIAAAVA